MSNGDSKGTILEAAKTILQSQVGGWMLACIAFGFMSWWVMQDRKIIYGDMMKLREHGLQIILETNEVVTKAIVAGSTNNELIREAKEVTEENNKVLKEIHSDIKLLLKRFKGEEEGNEG